MPDNVTMPSELLIERFENIYSSTYYKLYHFINKYVRDEDSVKDVLQESYIRLWEKLTTIQDDEKILPLLRTMVMNITIDTIRKKAREAERAKLFYEQRETTYHTDEALNIKEVVTAYNRSVNALPALRRKIYQLIQEEGLSYKEVAAQLSINLHTIKYHFTQARKTLSATIPEDKLVSVVVLISVLREL